MSESTLLVWTPLALEATAVRAGHPGPGVRVERCGVGPKRASATARRHDPESARALAVAGVCGSLDPKLSPGALVVPDEVRTPDGAVHATDSEGLLRALRERGFEASRGTLLGADHLVVGEERSTLFETTGARAVDMESPWLAAAAGGRPFAVLRVVVDAPGHELNRAGLLMRGIRALRTLRQTAPALGDWAHTATQMR